MRRRSMHHKILSAPRGRRFRHLLLSAASVAVAPTAALATPDRVEADDYWRVVEVTGDAHMLAGANPWNAAAPLAAGDVVGPYQSIATGAGASAILARGEDVVVVYENTTIELPPPADQTMETLIVQQGGTAFYAVDPRPDPQFAVETPYLVAGVKGTEFALVAGGARLEVIEGVVDAEERASGQHRDVPAGQGIGSASFAPAPLDPAMQAELSALSAEIAASSAARAENAAALADTEADTADDVDRGTSSWGYGNGNSGGNGNGNSGGNGNGNSGGNGNGNSGGNGHGNSGGNGSGNSGGSGNGNSGNGNGNSGGSGNGNGNS
jgi:hypothetical protein